MNSIHWRRGLVPAALALAVLLVTVPARAFDADEARMMLRRNNCLKCHSVDKKKEAPSYQDVAAKYRSRSDARERLWTHLTTGPQVKFADGHEEEHKILRPQNPDELKNLIDWILAQ
jgi:cytochrome c